ncbi:HlyD family efflux transporter periplasmic adaptor subunit [Aneurinibacillus sp. Ricciae_BoGa-3]|uniref:HlyD family secretion protein n=1 Tax=Aneurinibacillus sp. Ricciae_BoGa-3 TaxID=3022697 RepID=UPI00234251E5|nr:HlyD family efflux transporter periplasmic adaptor subunit [Aneurinibacillus sp. Ricciae_BoGa-3]WCK52673.1 HlyD family efflux transporter periplasmic adaptor subunit [Aneurinibacillus sp. Ricciae_BoGa-3]
MKRTLLNVVIFLCLLAIIAGGGYYLYQRASYISTDNAKVAADIVTVATPATGKLTKWSAKNGDSVQQGSVIGQQQSQAGQGASGGNANAAKQGKGQGTAAGQNNVVDIVSPIAGTVLQTNAVPHEIIAQGQPVAMIADLSKSYILAYIDEGSVKDVKIGKEADVFLDSDPGVKYTGNVSEIGNWAGTFLTPNSSSGSGNNNKKVERIPVKITVNNLQANDAPLGSNASVKIQK